MKTTSIYTLFFSPTGTSRKIAAAVAQGMAWTEGRATRASAGDNTAPESPAGQTPEAGTAAATPEPAAGNRGETKSMHGEPTVTAIDLTHPAGYPAPLPGEAVAIFAVPVYGGHVAPVALERDPRRRHPSRRSGRLRQPLVRHGRRRTRLVRRGTGIRARSGRGIRRRTFVQHARNPDRTGTPRRTGSDCRHGIRGSGARKISKNRAFPRQEPGNGIRHRSNHPGNQNRQHGCSQGPRNGRPCPHRPREAARTAYTAPPEAALHPVRTGLPPPAETQPRRPAARGCTQCGRCVALCPTQAIARGDELHTDPARCIRCCACVKGCAFGARTFRTPFAAALARNFARRKPPVTLL